MIINNYNISYCISNRYYYTNNINILFNDNIIKNITKLRINNMNIEKLPEKLERIKILIILHCNNIKEIPKYKTLKELYIYDCNNIMSIPELERLKKLNISFCDNLYEISDKLRELEELNILKTNIINIPNTYKKIKILKIDFNVNTINFPYEYYDAIFYDYFK